MSQLEKLGFIRVAPKGSRSLGYVLLVDPHQGVEQLREEGKVDDAWYNAYRQRRIETPAESYRSMPTDYDPDGLKLKILDAYIEHWELVKVEIDQGRTPNTKCAYELDMRDVLARITGVPVAGLDVTTQQWLDRMTRPRGDNEPTNALHICSDNEKRNGPHRFHARAYVNGKEWPAWEFRDVLRARLSSRQPRVPAKEREQKFGILLSEPQAERDFTGWMTPEQLPIAVIYVDLDDFKPLNARFTNAKVDETILPEARRLLDRLSRLRGAAYSHGGDEFVVILPNHEPYEVEAFAERLRATFEAHRFEVGGVQVPITVSVGVAMWPRAGAGYSEVLAAANAAQIEAKGAKNTVRFGS
jgi:diguanylate cyclase (GGDEF)-like protein